MALPAAFSWRYFLLTIIGAVAIAAGLFFAATRHFTSMELGITNAKLRNQLQDLRNEKRRLELEREVALTPNELKRTARSLGFRETAVLVKSDEKSADDKALPASVTETRPVVATAKETASGAPASPKPIVPPKAADTVALKPSEKKEKPGPAKPEARERKVVQPVEGGRARVVPVSGTAASKEMDGIKRTVISVSSVRRSDATTVVKF